MATKIALISDSHSHMDHTTLSYLQEVDEIWHAGDIGNREVMRVLPEGKIIRAVFGNIDDTDILEDYPEWQEFVCDQVKVLMTHIGGKPPRYAKGVKERILKSMPTIFICGHSHICKVEFDREMNCLYMNPGAMGQQGFHVMRTILLFDLEYGNVKNLRMVELGQRGK